MNIFNIVFTCCVFTLGNANTTDGPKETLEKTEFIRLQKSMKELHKFLIRFEDISNQQKTINTFFTLVEEFLALHSYKDEKKSNISATLKNQELRHVYTYFYASTMDTSSEETFTDSYITHYATWMKLNFEACASFYRNVENNEELAAECERLFDYLDVFVSTLSDIRSQLETLKEEVEKKRKIQEKEAKKKEGKEKEKKEKKKKDSMTDENILETLNEETEKKKEKIETKKKETKGNEKKEKEKKDSMIDENRINALNISDIPKLNYEACGMPAESPEKHHCKIWIDLLNEQPEEFRLNHVFFNAYLNINPQDQYEFQIKEFLHINNNKKLWEDAQTFIKLIETSQGNKIQLNTNMVLSEILYKKFLYMEGNLNEEDKNTFNKSFNELIAPFKPDTE